MNDDSSLPLFFLFVALVFIAWGGLANSYVDLEIIDYVQELCEDHYGVGQLLLETNDNHAFTEGNSYTVHCTNGVTFSDITSAHWSEENE